jgi:hypothetical protein
MNGKKFWTLFDSGAQNTYFTPGVALQLVTKKLGKIFRTALGGGTKKTGTAAILDADIQGRMVITNAMVIDEIA